MREVFTLVEGEAGQSMQEGCPEVELRRPRSLQALAAGPRSLSLETLQIPDMSPSFAKTNNSRLSLHRPWLEVPDAEFVFPPRGICSMS